MNTFRSRTETDPIKTGIRRSAVHSYGTTTSSLLQSTNAQTGSARPDVTPTHCIRHVLQPGETLQGIALRYGSSTHDIRRANRLLITDNIHLHESLLIPVPNRSAEDTTEPDAGQQQIDECGSKAPEAAVTQAVSAVPKSCSEYALSSDRGASGSQCVPLAANGKPSAADSVLPANNSGKAFFDKFDQFLADIKPNVNRMEEETGRIAKEYSVETDNSAVNNTDSTPSSTLLYRTASVAERKAKNGGDFVSSGSQRFRPNGRGAQNGSSSLFSRWFTFGASQAAVPRSNYVVTGYQSQLEHDTPNSISNHDDFYSI